MSRVHNVRLPDGLHAALDAEAARLNVAVGWLMTSILAQHAGFEAPRKRHTRDSAERMIQTRNAKREGNGDE